MSDHIAADELADAAEGLLDPADADRVSGHVATCAACKATADLLAEIPSVLAAQPAPSMPADITARLSSVVAAESERRAAGIEATTGPGALPWEARPSLGSFNEGYAKPTRSSIWYGALVAGAVAVMVGFVGFFLSSSAGLNEPQAGSPVVLTSQSLAPQLRALDHDDFSAHIFSSAWRCARQVTDGPISGIRKAVIDEGPALLVYQPRDSGTVVTVVTGCEVDSPQAGKTTVLDR